MTGDRTSRRRWARRLLSRGGGVLVVSALVACLGLTGDRPQPPSELQPAADAGQFNPGNIISDAIFFDGTAMDAGAVQTFLEVKNMSCTPGPDGTPCLKNWRQDTTERPADGFCNGYAAARGESAATIIAKSAVSCGVNPQVLLVLLQKEQGLVLGSGSALYPRRYRAAMGFACPDTAPCDPAFDGFQNQVYSSARQFKRYAASPTSFGYRAGRTSQVLFHPDSSLGCGSSPVYIQNQATAGLYIYTPYQPNAAALAAGYKTGDRCSSYGNRNFWLYFTDWFGSTQRPGQSVWQPVGELVQPTVANRVVSVSGWAVDPDDVDGQREVHVYADGRGVAVTRADQYSSVTGDYQGYSLRLPLAVGAHQICTYAINVGRGENNTHLGCRSVTVPAPLGSDPAGVVEAGTAGRAVTVGGWVLDPDTAGSPLDVHVYVDGAGVAVLRAGEAGAPTAAVYPGSGDAHRYSASLVVGGGRHEICAYGINVGAGTQNTHLGCRTVVVDRAAFNPQGGFDSLELSAGRLVVAGWARDLDATGPLQVHAYVDGAGSVLATGGAHPVHDGHGFRAALTTSPGTHRVCLYAINVGEGTTNPHLGCRDLRVDAKVFDPVGALDGVTAAGGTVAFSGWTADPDATAPVQVHVYADGRPQYPLVADQPHAGGPVGGYRGTLRLTDGRHQVCIYAINTGHGVTNTQLGCRDVTVTANPSGALEQVTSVGSAVRLSGWAADDDAGAAPVEVHVYADGAPQFPVRADVADATVSGHGYAATLTLAPGRHSVCTYAINVGPGTANTHLGCRAVTVSSNPGGALDEAVATGGTVRVAGWAQDPDASGQVTQVHVYAGGRPVLATAADQPHPTAGGAGYVASFELPEGQHQVCTYAINVGAGDANTHLGCRTVTVSRNPSGALEAATASGPQVTVSGWAVDPDEPAGVVQVHVYADGRPVRAVAADQPSARADGHGYGVTVELAPGRHSVCTYAINVGAGTSNTHLGCRSVTVS